MNIHIEGNKHLSIDPSNFEETSKDEATFYYDGMSYEAYWDYDGDEGWSAVEQDSALIAAIYPDKLERK